jgi:hypothetical protein
MNLIEKESDLTRFLEWVGPENFFFQVTVRGFRTQDENGDMQYVSDSIGQVQPAHGMGVFSRFMDRYKIMAHELYARYLSEGF